MPSYIVKIGGSIYSRYFDGILDEIKIYNRALSIEEILHNYNLH